MKTYGGVGVKVTSFLDLFTSEWSASRPDRFTPLKRVPGNRWIGVCVSPRTGLDDVEMRKIFPYRDSNSESSAVQPVARRFTDFRSQMNQKRNKTG
jgi:hypothetical protein